MKARIAIFILTLTAAGLAFANWQLRRGPIGALEPSQSPLESATPSATRGSALASSPEIDSTTIPRARPLPNSFDWTKIETTDYKRYVAHLRAVGFPEELIRTIIIADINKLYEPREAALKPRLIPYDAPLEQRQTHNISDDDWDRIRQLRAVRIEKQAALQEILGAYVPREIARTPISRNYEAYEYAISLMPEDKRNAVQMAQEDEIITEGFHKTRTPDRAEELEAFKRSREERDAALLKVLTPEEFERYEMNTTPAGTELARRVIGMEPSDDEFAAMFRIAYTNWVDTGGVYGRWRAVPVPSQKIAEANQVMDSNMKELLGPDRYLDYQMAISGNGQQLRNLAARFELPQDTIAQAFALQQQADQLSGQQQLRLRYGLQREGAGDAGPSIEERMAEVQRQLANVLGPEAAQAWQQGRNLKVDLSP